MLDVTLVFVVIAGACSYKFRFSSFADSCWQYDVEWNLTAKQIHLEGPFLINQNMHLKRNLCKMASVHRTSAY